MRLSDAIETLITATVADGRSPRTSAGYRQMLAPLLEHLGDVPVEAVTSADLRGYIAALRSRQSRYRGDASARPEAAGGLSPASIASHVRAVKRLFNFLEEEALLDDNVARRIRLPRPSRGEPKAYRIDDLEKLVAGTAGDDPVSRRNRALILFLADTGCRLGGLISLRLGDLDLPAQRAIVQEKGGKSRPLFVSVPTARSLERWLEVRPQVAHDYLWLNLSSGSHYGRPLAAEGVRQILKRLKAKTGVKGPVNPHAFRHGFARQYLLSGGDLASLADILGHTDIQTTWQSYSVFAVDELQQLHRRHSPIASLETEPEETENDDQ